MTHGHEIMDMMIGHSYANADELVKAVEEHFGKDERFYTCHAENLTARDLVNFLMDRGKFMHVGEDSFTVNPSTRCRH